MESSLTRLENNQVSLEVIASPQDVEAAVAAACRQIGHKLSIPGFRQGRIPRHIIEQRVGRDYLYQEAMEELVSGVISMPCMSINFTLSPTGTGNQRKTGRRRSLFSRPKSKYYRSEIGEYKGLQVKKATVSITDEQVEEEIAPPAAIRRIGERGKRAAGKGRFCPD